MLEIKKERKDIVEMTNELLDDTSKLIFKLAAESGINIFDVDTNDCGFGFGKDYLDLLKKSGELCKEQARLLAKIQDLDTRFDGLEESIGEILKEVKGLKKDK